MSHEKLDEILKKNDSLVILKEKAEKKFAVGDFKDASALYLEIIKKEKTVSNFVDLANAKLWDTDILRSIIYLNEALKLEPQNIDILAKLGFLHTRRKKYGKAKDILDIALKENTIKEKYNRYIETNKERIMKLLKINTINTDFLKKDLNAETHIYLGYLHLVSNNDIIKVAKETKKAETILKDIGQRISTSDEIKIFKWREAAIYNEFLAGKVNPNIQYKLCKDTVNIISDISEEKRLFKHYVAGIFSEILLNKTTAITNEALKNGKMRQEQIDFIYKTINYK